MSAPRPLVVHPHFHPRRTGVTRHVEMVVPALAEHQETRTLGRTLEPGLPTIGWRELWRRAGQEPVIWHAHRNNELLWGLALKALGRRVRVVFTRHSARPGRFTRLIARGADRVVALTAPMAAELHLPADVVGHGIDLSRFVPPQDRDEAWRALEVGGRWGIGVIGRVRPAKGQGDFVAALAPLLAAHPEWRAVLVGAVKPPEQGFAEALRAQGGSGLALLGERSDVERWYRGLTVMVQPSHTEGYSMVLLEAMASGCCVVAARLPYSEDAIVHGETGFLYPPGDVPALRSLLASLLADPARARAMGAAAAAAARTRFGVSHEAQALTRVYASLDR
ncbi:glycosyltransferase family 4 protein [Aggregicoccus sp. 17bor-14]|uniref:glycosyltransferase family 4 protein n=1 Tax=Myxococcaceae TaxID=31 RepID=UPI00351A8D7D